MFMIWLNFGRVLQEFFFFFSKCLIFFSVKYSFGHILWMVCLINVKQKKRMLIGCWACDLTLTLNYKLKFWNLYLRSQEWVVWMRWLEKEVNWLQAELRMCVLNLWPCLWPWPWIFKIKFWNTNWGMGGPLDMKEKGCEVIGYWNH